MQRVGIQSIFYNSFESLVKSKYFLIKTIKGDVILDSILIKRHIVNLQINWL